MTAKKLTQKEVREFVTSLGLSFQVREGNEFRIAYKLPGNKTHEDSAYYASDLDDAWCTAYAMAERQRNTVTITPDAGLVALCEGSLK